LSVLRLQTGLNCNRLDIHGVLAYQLLSEGTDDSTPIFHPAQGSLGPIRVAWRLVASLAAAGSAGAAWWQAAGSITETRRALNDVADGGGESDVIVEFYDDTESASRIAARRRAGRRHHNARAAGYQRALRRLANDPKVKRVHQDRD
jgi:hypothetical protein